MFAKLFYNDYSMLLHSSFLLSSCVSSIVSFHFSFIYFYFGVMFILYNSKLAPYCLWILNLADRDRDHLLLFIC